MPKTKRDYYEVLGIARGASPDEIKSSYRRLAKEYHPDRNPENRAEAEEKFKELSEAYEVLVDAEKRKLYDQFGHDGVSRQFGPGGFDFRRDFTHTEDLNDIFGDLLSGFGGRRGTGGLFDLLFGGAGVHRSRASRGGDIRIRMRLALEDIAEGVTKEVTFSRYEACAECKGKGGTGETTCTTCGGRGQVRRQSSSFLGQFVQVAACPDCEGEGRSVKEKCGACSGEGRARHSRTLKVRIPAGVSSGNYIPLHNEGNYGPGGKGDVLIEIQEKPHPLFTRQGDDILVAVPVPIAKAVLGGKVDVPTLKGTKRIDVAAGTAPGTLVRIRGGGIKHLDGGRGDELVRIEIEIPRSLSAEEKRLWKQLENLTGEAASKPHRPG